MIAVEEMALHKQIAADLELTVYFADPHAPWQRGSNGHTNGLVREYLPKGTDLSGYPQADLKKIANSQHPSTQETRLPYSGRGLSRFSAALYSPSRCCTSGLKSPCQSNDWRAVRRRSRDYFAPDAARKRGELFRRA